MATKRKIVGTFSESAKYSKHLINRVLHGAPIIEVIFFERREASACLINAERQAR